MSITKTIQTYKTALLELAVDDLISRKSGFPRPNALKMHALRQEVLDACEDMNQEQFTVTLMQSGFIELPAGEQP